MFLLYCELFQCSIHSCLCFIFVVVFNSLTRTGEAFRKYLPLSQCYPGDSLRVLDVEGFLYC